MSTSCWVTSEEAGLLNERIESCGICNYMASAQGRRILGAADRAG